MEYEKGDAPANLADQLPRSDNALTFGRHDGKIVPLGQLHGLEQRHEPFLFYEQHGTEAVPWTAGRIEVAAHVKRLRFDLVVADVMKVTANIKCAEGNLAIGVW